MMVQVEVEIDDQTLKYYLTGAVEGACDYWARFTQIKRAPDLSVLSVRVRADDANNEDAKVVTWEDIGCAIVALATATYGGPEKHRMPRHHIDNIVNENDDAETHDVLLQFAMFGQVVYS